MIPHDYSRYQRKWQGKRRYNSEIEQYNQKAIEVLGGIGVEINDLYSVTKYFDDSLRSDWVHYGLEGSQILADKVIEKCLSGEKQ